MGRQCAGRGGGSSQRKRGGAGPAALSARQPGPRAAYWRAPPVSRRTYRCHHRQGAQLYALLLVAECRGRWLRPIGALIPAGAPLGGPGRLLGFLFLPWLRIGHAGVDIRSGGNRHAVAPRVIHSGVVHHRQHVVERRHPPRSRRRHDAIAPRLSRPLWPAAARPATTPHECLISLCKSFNCTGQNQTAEKNSLHETQSWLVAWLDASHRNPTPYFGGQNLESFALGASLAQPAVSRPTAGLTRVRACARVRTENLY